MSNYTLRKPDDPGEVNRLDIQHQLWLLSLDGRLHTLNFLSSDSHVLDIGCGTGAWAISMAAHYPSAQVTAFDLTPPNINPLPSNLTVVQSNAEDEWPFTQPFDFIHGRMLIGGIRSWPYFLTQCWKHLALGGQIELLEITQSNASDLPTFNTDEASPFIKLGHTLSRAMASQGLDNYGCAKHVEKLEELGFVGIREQEIKWPLGNWGEGEKEKTIGLLCLKNFQTFIDTSVRGILVSGGLTEEEGEMLAEEGLQDLTNNCEKKRFFVPMKIWTATKPS